MSAPAAWARARKRAPTRQNNEKSAANSALVSSCEYSRINSLCGEGYADLPEKGQEARLLADDAALRADWLLVPHHGSKTSSTAAFLDAVAPRWALVQAGYRNRYGHPAAEVLARYAERDVQLLDSARCGAARWASAQADRVRCERIEQRRYWQHRPPG